MCEQNVNNNFPSEEWLQENAELDKIITEFQEKMKVEGIQL